MSCLIVKVGSTATHPDGEVISALSHRRVMQVHASHLCHVKRAGFADGRRPVDSLAWQMWELTSQYTTMRVSLDEVVQHDKRTGEIVTLEKTPKMIGGKWQHIAVDEYVRRRLRHHRHRIFGLPGKEVWHGGRSDFSEDTLATLWDRITLMTGQTCPHWWPAGRLDLKHHLVLPLADRLGDVAAKEMTGNVLYWRELVPPYLIPLIENRERTVNLYQLGFAANLGKTRLLTEAA